MADKAVLYKGVKFTVAANDLLPNTEYYAMLRDPDTDSYISTEKTTSDTDGSAMFEFPYTVTNNVNDDASLTLIIVEKDRGSIAFYKKNLVKVVATSLKDNKNIQSNQIAETESNG